MKYNAYLENQVFNFWRLYMFSVTFDEWLDSVYEDQVAILVSKHHISSMKPSCSVQNLLLASKITIETENTYYWLETHFSAHESSLQWAVTKNTWL